MAEYHLKLSGKTKFFNFFRRIFTNSFFGSLLYWCIHSLGLKILFKLVPPDYLYHSDSIRRVKRGQINYLLNLSHVVDHYTFWGFNDHIHDSLVEHIRSAKVILDIGANIATTSLFYANLNPSATILSFEPHPETYNRAMRNISLNSFQNIKLFNMGLGESKAQLKLYEVNEHNPGMNRITTGEQDLPFKWVDVDRLDTVLEVNQIGHVDFMKLDVEGFEYSVLKGAEKAICKSHPILLIELDDSYLKQNNSSAQQLITLLKDWGYTQLYRASNQQSITDNSVDFTNCHYDIVAIRK